MCKAAGRIRRPGAEEKYESPCEGSEPTIFSVLALEIEVLVSRVWKTATRLLDAAPDLETLGVLRRFGPCGPGTICPLPPPSRRP